MTESPPVGELEQRFGQRVQHFREAVRPKLSQRRIAARMREAGHPGWHQSTIQRTEAAERPIRLAEAVTLGAILGVPLAELIAEPGSGNGLTREIDAQIEATRRVKAALAEQESELVATRAALLAGEGRVVVGGGPAPAAVTLSGQGGMGGAIRTEGGNHG